MSTPIEIIRIQVIFLLTSAFLDISKFKQKPIKYKRITVHDSYGKKAGYLFIDVLYRPKQKKKQEQRDISLEKANDRQQLRPSKSISVLPNINVRRVDSNTPSLTIENNLRQAMNNRAKGAKSQRNLYHRDKLEELPIIE